ncbi:hypothetical protein GCM10027427_12200 [Pseudoclavibacter terrae]|uniref:Uncharacterized protein n=1 Tax=Pseudoclavibacter terrae TaxID=1530195 RepID=A0A7J5B6Q4_9MICO|nr:hypothetical protein F8O03_06085 [Pseudoclavibacter terrae]
MTPLQRFVHWFIARRATCPECKGPTTARRYCSEACARVDMDVHAY